MLRQVVEVRRTLWTISAEVRDRHQSADGSSRFDSLSAAEVFDAGPGLVIDLAADFRIHDPALHRRYYGAHPAPELVHRFRYGLADVEGDGLAGATA